MSAGHAMNQRKRKGSAPEENEELDVQARKRVEVGLAPRRPTAKATPIRPPDFQTLPLPPAVLAFILVAVVLVTAGLLAMNLTGRIPSWWPEWNRLEGISVVMNPGAARSLGQAGAGGSAATYSLRLTDDFSQASSSLNQGETPDAWRTALAPTESVYRMDVWPDHLAWSLLSIRNLDAHRLQTSAVVSGPTPEGYAGLIARYQDDRHFYLFAVDGGGRYRVQQQNGDQVRVLQPWTPASFLNPAGSANMLMIEDHGESVRFSVNNILLYELADPAYPMGFVGLAGGARGQETATVDFDWFQLFDAQVNDGAVEAGEANEANEAASTAEDTTP